ncbi:hypothetical protein HHI36_016057 [Cryptolaemus montrouzieri]|uniref:Sepiapterin reductase n=1 Tax=Cryptolaemus montrouzieri TaxID=559131 RepID=A0ABD2N7F4_9CUCU
MSTIDFSKKSLIFITGASRGIGRAIAIEITRIVNPKSALVLIASSAKGLQETKSLISEVNNSLNVVTYPLDLSAPSSEVYENLFDDVLKKTNNSELENAIFIHNAGTVGILKKSLDLTDVEEWKRFYDLNIISAIFLNTLFVKKSKNLAKKLIVINISSLCGIKPFVNMSMYGSVKAAREMFFKVFALEEPEVVILNYCPGPVDTDMFNSLVHTAQDETLRKSMSEVEPLKPKQTVEKLLGILQKGEFASGDTIDYFDRA